MRRLIAAVLTTGQILSVVVHGAGFPLSQATILKQQRDELILDTSFGIPFRIVFSSATVSQQFSDRVMFLSIEDRYCSPDLLRKVFTGLAERFQEPQFLRMDVYSDGEMLRRAIARYKTYPDDMIFPDTPEGVELEKKIRGDLYIPKEGWARARYYRDPKNGERFVYKPDVEKTEMVEVVLKPRPVPQYTGDRQEDLFLACRLADTAKARALIDGGAVIENKDKSGETPLVQAVRYNGLEVVRLLLQRGAYVDARNKYGQTVLTEAVSDGHVEIVRLLLEHNADANARYGGEISPLHLASYKGDADVVEALLSSGADPNARDDDGNTPLFDAIGSRKSVIVRSLLRKRAKVNVKNKRGLTPLMVAEELGDVDIVSLVKIPGA